MILILIAAFASLYGKHVLDQKRHALRTETYPVNDLISANGKPATFPHVSRLAAALEADLRRDPRSKGNQSVTPFFLNNSLIVRDSEEGHRLVMKWLEKRRSFLQNSPPAAQQPPGN